MHGYLCGSKYGLYIIWATMESEDQDPLKIYCRTKQTAEKKSFTKSMSACNVTVVGLELCSQVEVHPRGKQTQSALRGGYLSSTNGCEKQIVH